MEQELDLAKLIVPSKELTTEFQGYDGFEVTVAYLTREEIIKLKKKATTSKFNKKTRQPEEETDNDLFQDLYFDAVIKGWKGLKYKYLPDFLPVDSESLPEDGELPYSRENARTLMKNCTEFDTWITDLLDDVANFTKSSKN